jgi:hypothetical protein
MWLQLLFALLSSLPWPIFAAQCYWPNGKVAVGLVPCNTTAPASHCCRESDLCLTNGLCVSSGLSSVLRRACTDDKWNNSACPDFCTQGVCIPVWRWSNSKMAASTFFFQKLTNDGVEGSFREAESVMTPCGQYNKFCCGQDKTARDCCDNDNGTVTITSGELMIDNATTITVTVTSTASASPGSTNTGGERCQNNEGLRSTLQKRDTTVIALSAVLGCMAFAFGFVLWKWQSERRKEGRIIRLPRRAAGPSVI